MTSIRRSLSESGIQISSACDVDLPFLISLHQTMRPYVEQIWGWDPGKQEEFVKAELARGNAFCVSIAGNRVGMIEMEFKHDHWSVRNLRISPDAQGRGIGTMLLTAVMQTSSEQQMPVSLRVFRTNVRAISLYRRLGFIELDNNATHIRMSTNSGVSK